MWTKGSRSARSTPANARRTGKPSPSNPAGAVVTERTGRSRAPSRGRGRRSKLVRSSTVIAGIRVSLPSSNATRRVGIPPGIARAVLRDDAAVARHATEHRNVRRFDVSAPPRRFDLEIARTAGYRTCRELAEKPFDQHRRQHRIAGSEVRRIPGRAHLEQTLHAGVK